jgi:hypothetical protein
VEAYLASLRAGERAAWERRFLALDTEVQRTKRQRKAATGGTKEQTTKKRKSG